MNKILCCIAFFALFECAVAPALAQKRHHCFGRVQSYPCAQNQDTRKKTPGLEMKYLVPPQVRQGQSRFARVISQRFSRSPSPECSWHGVVEGNGDVHLQLQIIRNGRVETTRYMGYVTLYNRTSSFWFKTIPPPGSDWSWRIVATAT